MFNARIAIVGKTRNTEIPEGLKNTEHVILLLKEDLRTVWLVEKLCEIVREEAFELIGMKL